jgi:2-polyprenyl-3-methyl-5-hydroxy-6-metoxy-1,4-benzoquinol methylase
VGRIGLQLDRNNAMGPTALARLTHRCRQPELMDQPGLDAGEHDRALRGLGRINRVSRSAAILWPRIAKLARDREGGLVRVLDLASGGGDVPIALARRADRAGFDVRIDGCDLSTEAVRFARQQAKQCGAAVEFFPLDVLRQPIPRGYDIATCSLFLHHLDENDAIALLRKMAEAAGRLVLVNDLVRSRLGYLLAWVGCRLLSGSPVVRYDGPVSVKAAFTATEVLALAEQAGLRGAMVTRHWPQRFLLAWSRS